VEAVHVIDGITDGWILFIQSGTRLPADTFATLARHLNEDQLLFMMPEPYASAQTATGVPIAATRSKALFGLPEQFAHGRRERTAPRLSLLKVNS